MLNLKIINVVLLEARPIRSDYEFKYIERDETTKKNILIIVHTILRCFIAQLWSPPTRRLDVILAFVIHSYQMRHSSP